MAGEISTAGIKIYYAVESTAGSCPSSGFAEKASGATLNLADFVTGISGLTADIEKYDVTPLSVPVGGRRRFTPGLYGNDGSVTFNVNVNATSRADWGLIVSAFAALTGGKSIWWEVLLPGETDGYFFRGQPLAMQMPDTEVGQAVQGSVSIIESACTGFATKIVS